MPEPSAPPPPPQAANPLTISIAMGHDRGLETVPVCCVVDLCTVFTSRLF
jgi:hypothetical protein